MKTYFEGILEIEDNEDITDAMKKLPREQAVNILHTILSIAVNRGGYNLDETYIIIECLNIIRKNEDK